MTDKTEAMENLIAQDADLIDIGTKRVAEVTEADRNLFIHLVGADDETASRIHRGLIYTWEVRLFARHRQQATEALTIENERLRDALIKASREIQGYKDALAQVWADTNGDDET